MAMDAFRSTYRGYYIYVVRKSDRWSCKAEPIRPELPVLTPSYFGRFAHIETALAEARDRIDRVVALFPVRASD
jgi:hypothetical protein